MISTSVPALHHFVTVGRHDLHVMEFGRPRDDSSPVLLLHGVGGSSWIWHDVVEALAPDVHALAMDLRGYGASDRSPDQRYATADHGADVVEVLATLGIEQVVVAGFSWGGLVAIRAASTTDSIRRLVVVDIPPASERSQDDVIPFTMEYDDLRAAVQAQRDLTRAADPETLERVVRLTTHPVTGGRVRDHDPHFSRRWPFLEEDHWEDLESLRQPVLIVRAQDSPVLPAAVATRMRDRAANAELTEIADSGHLLPLDQPARLARAITGFAGV